MPMRRVGRQVAGPGQYSRPAARSQWFATVLSGSTTLGQQHGQVGSYGATTARRQRHGTPVRHRHRPSDATAPCHTTDRVHGGRQQDQTCPRRSRHYLPLLTIVPNSIGFDLPRGHLSGLKTHYNCPTLSYKSLG
jgi:hypothetical protein